MDVFSRMAVGMYVGLEGPSWAGAMMAVTNVVANKKAYCAEYEIEINEDDWPCCHLPEILLADKGELEGYNVERLVKAFNLHVENAASYRADWKGIVEKQFDLIHKKVKPMLPGYIDVDFQERGAKDYRLDAKLTLREFTQILQYNTKYYLKSYVRDKDLVADDVQAIPLELCNWGIQNRTGKLRVFPEELVKLQLLPRGIATVNHKGIQFKGISYSCDKALKDVWFENARMRGSWKVELAYDPQNMSHVYVVDDSLGYFEECYMLDVSKRYEGLSLDEITYWRQDEKQLEKEQNHQQLQAVYVEQEVVDFRGNPLIEALPPILSPEEAYEKMSYYPAFDAIEAPLPTHVRYYAIPRINRFFQPVMQHLDLEQRFSRLLRHGYVSRNPRLPDYNRALNGTQDIRSTASSMTLMEFSGIGTTTAIERILSLYPQVILH